MSPTIYKIKCGLCGKPHKAKRKWAEFCSDKCKNDASIVRRAEAIKSKRKAVK